jgi:DNA helicase TIP49 (TBP-interacting protein)
MVKKTPVQVAGHLIGSECMQCGKQYVNIPPGRIFTKRGFNSVVTLHEVDYDSETNTFRLSLAT